MTTMQAIVMTATGGPEVLARHRVPLPALPTDQHVRVRLHAAGVNPVDTKLRKGGTYYPDIPNAILGCDGAGVVEAVGAKVRRFRPGDRVFFFQGGIGREGGCYAEYICVHEDFVSVLPDEVDFIRAAALPLVFITAWESLHDRARVQAGESVLIHAAAGGVGHLAVQVAKHAGAQVAATVGDEDKAAFAQALGADRVIEYKMTDFVQAALDWTHGHGVDVTFDTVGGETFCRSFAATRVYGRVVTLLQTACDANAMKVARLRNQSIHYELMLTPQFHDLHAARAHQRGMLDRAAAWLSEGTLRVHVSEVLPLAEAAEAHRRVEAGRTTGKIVLRID